MKANAANTAPPGTVVTLASKISPAFRHVACRLEAPMPNSAPMLTCLVLTGRNKIVVGTRSASRSSVFLRLHGMLLQGCGLPP